MAIKMNSRDPRGRQFPTTQWHLVLVAGQASSPQSQEALATLCRTYWYPLYGFVRRQGLSDDLARDAVQETLLRLWRELRSGASIDNPRAWAYRAIYRLAMDQHRLGTRFRLITGRLADLHRPTADPADSTSDRLAVWAEVDRLPPRQRQVLYLRYRSDLSFEEIGAVLGISASAGRSHATQALATLRRRLAAEDIG
jgi:RNA polymerase sigma-70 factor (ECF subfamily)